MELRDYLKIYWQQRWLIGLIVLIATATTFIVTSLKPERIGVSESYAVNRLAQPATADYQYDGFYALQAVDLFSQTVVSWFNTPSVLREIYLAANLDPEIASLNNLPSRFSVKRYSAQNIVIRFSESTHDRAERVANAMRTVMEERASKLNLTPEGKALFEVQGSVPVINPVKPNPWVLSAVALVLSGALGLGLAVGRHYLRA
jgi:capsular polysaccharide biosynthesis protein